MLKWSVSLFIRTSIFDKKKKKKKNVMRHTVKGRFLLFQVYHNFAILFSKLSVSTFYKVISKFQQKVQR